MDTSNALQVIKRRVGTPPRTGLFQFVRNWKLRRAILSGKRIHAPAHDETNRIYQYQDQIITYGEVRWAVIVQANSSLFEPGKNTSGAQVIYSPSGYAPIDTLEHVARSIFSLKGTKREAEDERKLIDMITDEYIRALDWKIPKSLSAGFDIVTTIMVVPRDHLPNGILLNRPIPILADPKTSLVQLIPKSYWEHGLRESWQKQASLVVEAFANKRIQSKKKFKQNPPITITKRAADEFSQRIRSSGLVVSSARVRISVSFPSEGLGQYGLSFEEKKAVSSEEFDFKVESTQFIVSFDDLSELDGVTIDWVVDGDAVGFKFIRPGE